ncbi:hypothetical protein [Methanorbis rubei]|uniref:Uncharacterized protein n=1 Tax=Methanorbis rubei TaxID=3028300 RepID=A0AAE4MGH2_9EURY|nr:hypothetical protein [Methanocorpusculaceae archaeon Cs1]
MADNTKLGTILILVVVCVGVLLIVSSGISALQSYQTIADPDNETVTQTPEMTTTSVPTTAPSVASTASSVPAATTLGATETVRTLTQPTATVTASVTIATQSTSPTVSQTTAAAPAKAPAAGDPILGNWAGEKTMTIVFVSAHGSATATFRDDYSGSAAGDFQGAGRDETFDANFIWENLGNGKYLGAYGDKTLEFSLDGEVLTMTLNPKKLGVVESEILNMDIPFEMHRV